MNKNRKKLIADILIKYKKGLHISDIAEELLRIEDENISKEELINKISAILSSDIRRYKKKSKFTKIKNKKGGNKKGWYKIKIKRKTVKEKAIKDIQPGLKIETPSISSLYTGKAGEYAVLSELLFNEFNASLMSVDEGIDIIASKKKKFFYIQVKTANNRNGSFYSTVSRGQFDKFIDDNPFYIFVLRYSHNDKIRSGFIVFQNSDIERFIETKIVNNGANLNFNFSISGQKILLNFKENVSFFFNNFKYILK